MNINEVEKKKENHFFLFFSTKSKGIQTLLCRLCRRHFPSFFFFLHFGGPAIDKIWWFSEMCGLSQVIHWTNHIFYLVLVFPKVYKYMQLRRHFYFSDISFSFILGSKYNQFKAQQGTYRWYGLMKKRTTLHLHYAFLFFKRFLNSIAYEQVILV